MKKILVFITSSVFVIYLLGKVDTLLAEDSANVFVDPANTSASINQLVELKIGVSSFNDAGGFDMQVLYDPSVVTIPSSESVSLGDFLGSTGRTVTFSGTPVIDNDLGLLTVGAFTFGSGEGASGDGTLLLITFETKEEGKSQITLSNATLYKSDASEHPQSLTNGEIVVGDANAKKYIPTEIPSEESNPTFAEEKTTEKKIDKDTQPTQVLSPSGKPSDLLEEEKIQKPKKRWCGILPRLCNLIYGEEEYEVMTEDVSDQKKKTWFWCKFLPFLCK